MVADALAQVLCSSLAAVGDRATLACWNCCSVAEETTLRAGMPATGAVEAVLGRVEAARVRRGAVPVAHAVADDVDGGHSVAV